MKARIAVFAYETGMELLANRGRLRGNRNPKKPPTRRAVGCAVTPFDLRKTRRFSHRLFRRTHYEKSAKGPAFAGNTGSQVPTGLWTLRPAWRGEARILARLATLPPASNSRNLREKLQKSNGATVNSLRTSRE
jgi:hypothetical protein